MKASIFLFIAGLAVVLAMPRIANAAPPVKANAAKQIGYVGGHPVPADQGGGFCLIAGPHVHIYQPANADVLYRVHGGRYFFVGDPVPFGYEGATHAYRGRHPIAIDLVLRETEQGDHDVEFCYLDGPHYHAFEPPAAASFVLRGGAYWYVGAWPRAYAVEGPRYVKVNAIYKGLVYTRPVITVHPPDGWSVPVIRVASPRVVVHRPMPVIEVELPWLVVEERGYRYYHHHHHHDEHDDDDNDDD